MDERKTASPVSLTVQLAALLIGIMVAITVVGRDPVRSVGQFVDVFQVGKLLLPGSSAKFLLAAKVDQAAVPVPGGTIAFKPAPGSADEKFIEALEEYFEDPVKHGPSAIRRMARTALNTSEPASTLPLLGWAFAAEEDYARALENFRLALRFAPDDIANKTNAALALVQLKRYDEAIDYVDEILTADPSQTVARQIKTVLEKKGYGS